MAATVYLWHTLRFDVFHVNPPLTRIVCGLPVALCQPKSNWDCYSSRPQDRSEWVMGRAFITANTLETSRWCFVLARWALIPLILLGGYCGYRLSGNLYGDSAAFVFLMLWVFSPLLLAWGGTICPDAVAAALGVVALYTLHQWLRQPTWTRAVVAGACLGLLPLTKLTWLLAFGLWPLIWCVWRGPSLWRKPGECSPTPPSGWQLLVVWLLGLYVLNLGYLFDGTGHPLGQYTFVSRALSGPQPSEGPAAPASGNRFAGTWLGAVPVPLPAEFVQGIDTQRLDFERGMPSYCAGTWSEHGWWYYYLYASLVKMPLGTWCLGLLALGVSLWGRGYNAAWRDEMLILLPLVALSALVSSQTGFSAHTRYILPAIPLLFLWISKVGRAMTLGHRRLARATALALAWMVLSSLWIYPHSLSYFNELAGGPRNGAEHLLGSNLDWGQDLFFLEKWCQTHPDAQPLRVAYDGIYPLEKTTITSAGGPVLEVDPALAHASTTYSWPKPGWYAVSVNEIYAQSETYRCFLRLQPAASAGYSICIYHVTPDDVDRLRQDRARAEPPTATPSGDALPR